MTVLVVRFRYYSSMRVFLLHSSVHPLFEHSLVVVHLCSGDALYQASLSGAELYGLSHAIMHAQIRTMSVVKFTKSITHPTATCHEESFVDRTAHLFVV